MPNGYEVPGLEQFRGLLGESGGLIGLSQAQLAQHFGLGSQYGQYFSPVSTDVAGQLGEIGAEQQTRLGQVGEQYQYGAGQAREAGAGGLLGLTQQLQRRQAASGFAGGGAAAAARQRGGRGIRRGYGQELGRLGAQREAGVFQAGQTAQSDLDRLLAMVQGQLQDIYGQALDIRAMDPGDTGTDPIVGPGTISLDGQEGPDYPGETITAFDEWLKDNPGGTMEEYLEWLENQSAPPPPVSGPTGGDELTDLFRQI